jgi:DtxR family transcriptional regulator, Mn-dependent transcriptional regulator
MDNRQVIARTEGVRGARITPAMEDYLKAIFRIEHDGREVTNQRLTEELGLSGASVSNMLKRLHELHLVEYTPYKAISLTDAGNAVALEVVRHHRLLELFLAQALGMDIDQVHAEADRLEHHVSEELERRIEHALGYPEFDPHGHPIPTRAGTLPVIPDVPLTDLAEGEAGIVSRLSDRDEDNLREISGWSITPGAHLTMTQITETHVYARIDASEPVRIPRSSAETILVLRPDQATS